ncbi:HNH endonuclease signature motif containing protein [Blastococcus sp. VKM Ac-2987]|uniref:HNH endonuclease signature motif containing protein n=1 Tax=Blastococcus sp. VKM Ac-2987 TaxID=3004141 RepID=UPI0022AB9AFD|nr:HNH endonuclease signature motif containing protein [Blastococcus sp. VKM Ac-2987]MCZ2858240.1 HNH endonuclease [Blastococcus sp. VKM Ac-2987]
MIDGGQREGVAQAAAPAAGWASGPLGAVQAADREIARQTALRARAVAEFAATRPASADRPPGEPGAMSAERRAARPEVLADVSEWAVQELAVALSSSSQAAQTLLVRSLTLVHRLPRTLAALESGALHVGHPWPLLEKVAPIREAAVRARVEADLLAWARGRVTTPAQLGAKARRMVLARDARDAAGRLSARLRERGVFVHPDATEGMAVVSSLLTVPEAQALLDALGRYADALGDPEDQRTRGQKMADCLLDCVLRPGETDLRPVQAQLTVVAGVTTLAGGDEPGEIGGEPVPAEMVRALARALGLLPGAAATSDAVDGESVPATPATARPTATPVAPASAPLPPPLLPPRPVAQPVTEERALEEWWAETEARVLLEQRGGGENPPPEEWGGGDDPPLEEWGGEEDPPPEELARYWAEQARWQAMPSAADVLSSSLDPWPAAAPVTDVLPTTWADADRAVTTTGAALLELERALGRAGEAVRSAEIADVVDAGKLTVAADGIHAADADAGDDAVGSADAAGAVDAGGPADQDPRRSRRGEGAPAVPEALSALAAVTDEQRAALADLLDRTGGGLVDRPRVALVDALDGALLALTDSRELRRLAHCGADACRRDPGRCIHDLQHRAGLGPPPESPGYRPGAALDRYLRARDRRCRFPGCRRPVPRAGELDHDRPWPDGPTSAANLAGYCTPHHRGKHQAPGWQHELAADGTLSVTTPTGLLSCTSPPPY